MDTADDEVGVEAVAKADEAFAAFSDLACKYSLPCRHTGETIIIDALGHVVVESTGKRYRRSRNLELWIAMMKELGQTDQTELFRRICAVRRSTRHRMWSDLRAAGVATMPDLEASPEVEGATMQVVCTSCGEDLGAPIESSQFHCPRCNKINDVPVPTPPPQRRGKTGFEFVESSSDDSS
jgi:hypothetical protein